jgi:phage antirepressor YoqD-like protein
MNAVANLPQTMTSLEIAQLVEQRHDNVKRTVETLGLKGVVTLPQIEEVPNPGPGPKMIGVYRVGKRDSYVIVAQLSPEFTARLVDRWQELEARAVIPVPGFAIPTNLAQALRLAADKAEEAERANAALAIAAPKAEALDRLSSADGSVCITNAAKDLKMRPKDLFAWLSRNQWIYRRMGGAGWLAHQTRLQQGVLEHKVTTIERSDGTERVVEQVLVTAKGLARLAESVQREPARVAA